QQVEFRLAFRGYQERDVDAFLDRVTEDLSFYLEENQRLRSGAAVGGPIAPPAAGEDDARSEAEAIVARAREEAAAIVREAEQQAAAVRAAGGAVSGDPRAAVAPFLNREREFLQGLGSLVQTHAEEIKQMVLAVRARAKSAPPIPAEEGPGHGVSEAASAAEIRQRLGEPESEETRGSDPVILESATEPAYSSEGAPAGEGRERSLRELFWGED
ncbi:MAG: DivIVA domain-containing protein, partial [Actinomycetota bacterium]